MNVITADTQVLRLFLNLVISIMGSVCLYRIMPHFKDMFIKADLKGIDLNKKDKHVM